MLLSRDDVYSNALTVRKHLDFNISCHEVNICCFSNVPFFIAFSPLLLLWLGTFVSTANGECPLSEAHLKVQHCCNIEVLIIWQLWSGYYASKIVFAVINSDNWDSFLSFVMLQRETIVINWVVRSENKAIRLPFKLNFQSKSTHTNRIFRQNAARINWIDSWCWFYIFFCIDMCSAICSVRLNFFPFLSKTYIPIWKKWHVAHGVVSSSSPLPAFVVGQCARAHLLSCAACDHNPLLLLYHLLHT